MYEKFLGSSWARKKARFVRAPSCSGMKITFAVRQSDNVPGISPRIFRLAVIMPKDSFSGRSTGLRVSFPARGRNSKRIGDGDDDSIAENADEREA